MSETKKTDATHTQARSEASERAREDARRARSASEAARDMRRAKAEAARSERGAGDAFSKGGPQSAASGKGKASSKGDTSGKGQASRAAASVAGKSKQKGTSHSKRQTKLISTRVRDRARLSERIGHSTRLRLFIESSIPDFILVVIVSTALTFTLSYGFYSAWDYRGNIALITVISIFMSLALFLGSWSKKALAPSALAAVIVAGVVVGGAIASSPEPMFSDGLNDVSGNYGIFALLAVVVPVVTFLLSRRTVTLVFLLAFAVISCGTIQFLYRDWMTDQPGIPATIVVMIGIGMMFVYQCYKQSIYSANRLKRTSFAGAFAFSALTGVVCVLVGALVFYGLIQAAGLTTPEIKFFEEYVSPPTVEVDSNYQEKDDEGDETTDETNDEEEETSQEGEGGDSDQQDSSVLGFLDQTIMADAARAIVGLTQQQSDDDTGAEDIQYLIIVWTLIITILLIVLLALSIILFQRYRRTLRLKRIEKRSNAYQVWYLYTFLLGRFRRLRIRKPAQLTPLEFAVGFSKAMLPFTRETGGVDFVEVSSLYQDVVFGDCQPTDEELARVKDYYRAFFKNARQYVGWPKWLLYKYWRI